MTAERCAGGLLQLPETAVLAHRLLTEAHLLQRLAASWKRQCSTPEERGLACSQR